MRKKIDNIIKIYLTDIEKVEQLNLEIFKSVEQGIITSRNCLQKLRVILRNGKFVKKEDEIHFFKKQKPIVFGKLKYYAKLYKYLLRKPKGTNKSKRNFVDSEIKKLHDYFLENSYFVKYNRQDLGHLDEFYFLRGNDNLGLIADASHFYTDVEFSTSHDSSVAKIIAYDLLLNFYSEELNALQKPTVGNQRDALSTRLNLIWNNNKIDLVELTYALVASGAVKSDIKELAMVFEYIFKIDLGNFYRSFLEMRGRKENPTRFIDSLKQGLLKRMEDVDE